MRIPFRGVLPAPVRRWIDRCDDPDHQICEALRRMKENQIRHRERAVRFISQANNLSTVYYAQKRMARKLEREERELLRDGDQTGAEAARKDRESLLKELPQLESELAHARTMVDTVKRDIRNEEDRFRKATARALAAKHLMEAAPSEQAIRDIMEGLRRDGYLDLPPEGPGDPRPTTP